MTFDHLYKLFQENEKTEADLSKNDQIGRMMKRPSVASSSSSSISFVDELAGRCIDLDHEEDSAVFGRSHYCLSEHVY